MAFYRELDLGTSGDNEWDESKCGNLVLLSARPHVYKGALSPSPAHRHAPPCTSVDTFIALHTAASAARDTFHNMLLCSR